MAEFRMPSLGADMDAGTVSQWLVRPGDHVSKGDIVAIVETDKSTVEVECFDTGTVGELLIEPGQRVPVGTVLATITEQPVATPSGGAAERAAAGRAASAPPAEGMPPRVESPLVRRLAHRHNVALGTIRGTGPSGVITREDVERASAGPARIMASPLARRLAAELGTDLATVRGTGIGGAVRAEDVRRAAERPSEAVPAETTPAAPPEPAPVVTAPPAEPVGAEERQAGMRQAIARAMARSQREIPHYYLGDTIDLARALDWMREHNRRLPVGERLVSSALLLKAAAVALRDVPRLNGFWADGDFAPGDGVHLGVAISLRGGGLMAPAIRDADRLSLTELMAALRDLVARTRSGRLRGSELTDATITVTNLGDQGVEFVHGVIYPPQVALVGFGTTVERPCAVDGLIGVHPMVTATLAADHRATDGYTGGRYLRAVARLLQRPEEL
ncbi:dihydrolipoamide acetyltransferase family protein [Actinoallomurus iriomotensis]|uniref:Dihydrolipoamide acetyltransferase component of pyruvate dehydrogenase complex n=1 Tax=Actinoallomurus iriomotensis TaxID=478107 RepID=A0A9W6W3H5_9ACTN|nr:dihydrolipoamide acetyltransferase family protein [Actinoallomurus iriomotensis]GLY88912.1 acetyltransferase component of pyruvate dehydrogenase complex [Actinoallomurus iriomotensis]